MHWRRFNGDPIQKPIYEAVEEILQREHERSNKLKVCIGSDSQVRGRITEFATVIVFLREKNGGFMFIRNEKKLLPAWRSKSVCFRKFQNP